MDQQIDAPGNSDAAPDALPFVAPCRSIGLDAPWRWLRLGWRDLCAAPVQSLSYGVGISLLSAGVSGFAYRYGTAWLVIMLLSGFVFVAPVLGLGL